MLDGIFLPHFLVRLERNAHAEIKKTSAEKIVVHRNASSH
jgi:hypothetical protein